MIAGSVAIEWHGVPLVLLPDRAVWMPGPRTLLVADVHLGKPASFRAAGVPVPESVTDRDLARLTTLIGRTDARALIVLGDLVHDRSANESLTSDRVAAWRREHPRVEIGLVVGNHDRRAMCEQRWGIGDLGDRAETGGLSLVHDPADADERPTLAGHLHPVVTVGEPGRPGGVRTPCFTFDGPVGVLPAFGSFTGGRRAGAGPGAALFAAGTGSVVPISPAARACCDAHARAYDLG